MKFVIKNEVSHPDGEGTWKLCFQWGTFTFAENEKKDGFEDADGFRFIWRDSKGHLQAVRGQAKIPDKQMLFLLLAKASRDGWF